MSRKKRPQVRCPLRPVHCTVSFEATTVSLKAGTVGAAAGSGLSAIFRQRVLSPTTSQPPLFILPPFFLPRALHFVCCSSTTLFVRTCKGSYMADGDDDGVDGEAGDDGDDGDDGDAGDAGVSAGKP